MNMEKVQLRKLTDEYELVKHHVIGEGAYGKVYLARRGHEEFAVKIMHSQMEGGRYKLVTSNASLREIKLLRELTHPNIVALRDQFLNLDDMTLALVYELAKTDLRRVIWDHHRMKKPMSDMLVRCLMFQLLRGVQYLHENWVLHRDLKPENVLIATTLSACKGSAPKVPCFVPGVPLLKICDFGLARIFQSPVRALSDVERVVATLWYRAPELLLGSRHYTTAVDVWAVGCIFAEMFNRKQLFPGEEVKGKGAPFQESQCQTIFKVLGVPSEARWPGVSHLLHYPRISSWNHGYPSESMLRNAVPSMTDPAAVNLLTRLLLLDPAKRITAAEALQHEYFHPVRKAMNAEHGKAAASAQAQKKKKRRRAHSPGRGGGVRNVRARKSGGVGTGAGSGAGAAGAGAGVAVSSSGRKQ